MKCRTDFVTNSSSSSFILGKKDDDISVDTVYSIIRDLYVEYCSQKTKLIEYIKSVPNFGLHYNEKKGELYFKSDSLRSYNRQTIDNFLQSEFGISTEESFHYDVSWLDCKTYEEYERYWINRIKTKYLAAPFSIGDFSKDKIIKIHNGETESTELDGSSYSLVFNWYYDFHYPNLKESLMDLRNKNSDAYKSACLNILGKICVFSDYGCIPYYVVSRLGKFCTYCCDHMG